MSSNQNDDNFDPKYSLVYLNSTAALMETMFKNMKDEDFVYPAKKEIGADVGVIIRSEEHLKRQRESAMENSYLVRDTYLESVLSKMTDDDFTYGSNKPADPNFGRVVRALELMELTGTSTEGKVSEDVKEEPKIETEVPQTETVIETEKITRQPEVVSPPIKQNGTHDVQVKQGRANKTSGSYNRRQSYKGRVKYDLQTWRNDGCSFANDQGVDTKQSKKPKSRHSMNGQSGPVHNNPQVASNTFYANPTFSPQNGMFESYSNINGASYHGSVSNGNATNNGYTGYNGFNTNTGDCRLMGGNPPSNAPRMEFWNGGYNDNQQSWR